MNALDESSDGRSPQVSGRPLRIVMGSAPGISMRCKLPAAWVPEPNTGVRSLIVGTLETWHRIAVFTTAATAKGKSARMLILEPDAPDAEDSQLNHASFRIVGKFRITSRINNPRRAAAEWKQFCAA